LILALGLAFALASVGAWQERRSLEALDKGSWSWAIRTRTPVAAACVSVLARATRIQAVGAERSSSQDEAWV
jgi:hypothetical protein